MPQLTIDDFRRLKGDMDLERQSFIGHWRDLAEFVRPRRMRAFVKDTNKGDRRSQKIIDSTATFALQTLASGMMAGLSSPSRPWFLLSTPDPDLAHFGPVRTWLHDVTIRMHAVMLKSNIYTAYPTLYADEGLFGQAAMAILEDDRDVFRCYPYPIGTYTLAISNRGLIDTFAREYSMIVRQIVNEYGLENVSQAVKDAWDKSNYHQRFDVAWTVMPNPDPNPRRMDPYESMPWVSVHFEIGTNEDKFLRKSGFPEFPIMAPRWDVVAEDTYASDSPGMTALGDIRQLQTEQRRKAQGIEKLVNPPVQGPSHLRGKVSLLPGDYTAVDVAQRDQGVRPIHEIQMNVEHLRLDIQDVRGLIQRAFHEDIFLMLARSDRRQMTATEVAERHEEKLLVLGPVVERNNDELHKPTIDRIYNIMDRAGLIPPPPPDLEGVDLKVEYLSILSQAQKLSNKSLMDSFMGDIFDVAQMFPIARYRINGSKVVDEYASLTGVNPDLLVDEDEAVEQMQAEVQAAQQRQQAETAAIGASAAKDLGQTDMSQDSALRRAIQGA